MTRPCSHVLIVILVLIVIFIFVLLVGPACLQWSRCCRGSA
jgi:hypothetical protein